MYDGPDRRSEHCEMHTANTATLTTCSNDIAGIKGSLATGRWIFGLILGVAVLLVGSTFSDIKESLREIRADVKEVKTVTMPLTYRMDILERDMQNRRDAVRK